MKSIDLLTSAPTLSEVLDLAGRENVMLRTAEGRKFIVVEIDDFAEEVAAVRRNPELKRLLAERSAETTKYTAEQVRERLREP